jgi:hypothetical protein
VLSGLGLLTTLAAASGFLAAGVVTLMQRSFSLTEALPFFSMACSAGLFSLILIPPLYYSICKLTGWKPLILKFTGSFKLASALLIVWLALLPIGNRLSDQNGPGELLIPILQLLAVGIPLLWIVEYGSRGLAGGSPERTWGTLSFSVLITPWLAVAVEVLLIVGLIIFATIWLVSQPGAAENINRLAQRLANSGADRDVIIRIMQPMLQQPGVIFSMLALSAGLIPLIEEFLKPLALFVLVRKQLTPAEGYMAGLLCGSAFALVESLGNLANPSPTSWAAIVFGRAGTGLLHTVNTGMIGWGLASAWQYKKYLQLGIIYLVAVTFHGLWNTFAILMALDSLSGQASQPANLAIFERLGQIAPLVLGILMIILVIILTEWNRRLRPSQAVLVESIENQMVEM